MAGAGTTGRSRAVLVAVSLIVVAVVVVIAVSVVMFVAGGDDADGGDDRVEFREKWSSRVSALGEVEPTEPVRLAWADDDLVVIRAAVAEEFSDDEGETVMVGLDAGTGEQRWELRVTSALGSGAQVHRVDDVVVVSEFKQFEINDDEELMARLYGIDARSGDELWRLDRVLSDQAWVVTERGLLATRYTEGDGERLGNEVVMIDAATGDEVWQMDGGDGGVGLFRLQFVRTGGLVVLDAPPSDADGRGTLELVGVGLDGEERWRQEIDGFPEIFDSQPGSTSDVVVSLVESELMAYDLATGEVRWTERAEDEGSTTVHVDQATESVVICHSDDDVLDVVVRDLSDGAARWDVSLDGEGQSYFGLSHGQVITGATGPVSGGCRPFDSVVVADEFTASDLVTGDEVWRAEPEDGSVFASGRTGRGEAGFTSVQVFDLGADARSLIDPVTGETIAEVTAETMADEGSSSSDDVRLPDLRQVGRTAVGRVVGDDGFRLFDAGPDAGSDAASIEFDRSAQLVGDAQGVMYVSDGRRLVAVD